MKCILYSNTKTMRGHKTKKYFIISIESIPGSKTLYFRDLLTVNIHGIIYIEMLYEYTNDMNTQVKSCSTNRFIWT